MTSISASQPALPLSGLHVLDLTRLLPGGYASQMLADMGADVLKIEEPGTGDYARTMAPLSDAAGGTSGVGHAFLAVNRRKRSAAINLKHPAGREAFLRLVDGADVVLESFRPGVMDRLGLGHPVLRARNRRLVVCAITGYGQSGPYSQRAGHDLNYIGYAGLLAHLQRPGQPPTLPGPQLADIGGGSLMAVIGILSALIGRGVSGEGRIVDVAMLDGAMALLPLLASMTQLGVSEPAPGQDWLAGALACYNVYETADGRFITLGALEPKFWAAFCRAIGREELIARQFPRDAADRDAVMAEVAAVMRGKTRDQWVAELGDADVCLGPVQSLTEALADPQVRARGVARSTPAAEGSIPAGIRYTPLISDAPVAADAAWPALGADTAEALLAAGFTREQIAELAATEAIALGA